jgi:type VI protein secretion system component Hcp
MAVEDIPAALPGAKENMAIGDNFMWDPDGVIVGETSDAFFSQCEAFEVLKFGFCVDNGKEVGTESEDDDDEEAKKKKAAKIITSKVGVIPGKLKFHAITIDKVVDSASTFLYKACCSEDPIPTLMLATRKAGGDALLYLQYMFRDNHVTSITWSGGSGTERTQESFTMDFKAMGMQYIQQGPDGKPMPLKRWDWNVVKLTSAGKGTSTLDIIDGSPAPRFLPGVTKMPK